MVHTRADRANRIRPAHCRAQARLRGIEEAHQAKEDELKEWAARLEAYEAEQEWDHWRKDAMRKISSEIERKVPPDEWRQRMQRVLTTLELTRRENARLKGMTAPGDSRAESITDDLLRRNEELTAQADRIISLSTHPQTPTISAAPHPPYIPCSRPARLLDIQCRRHRHCHRHRNRNPNPDPNPNPNPNPNPKSNLPLPHQTMPILSTPKLLSLNGGYRAEVEPSELMFKLVRTQLPLAPFATTDASGCNDSAVLRWRLQL